MDNMYMPIENTKKLLSKITPKYSYRSGEDLAEFQKAGRKKLCDLLGLLEIQKNYKKGKIEIISNVYAEDLKCREIKFRFESERGVFVPCTLLIPKNINSALPLLVTLHGHSTGVHTSLGRTLYPIDEKTIAEQRCDIARQAVNEGYITLTLEHRGFGERGGDENGSRCAHESYNALLLGRTLLGERVWDAMKAIEITHEYFPEYTKMRETALIGYSGGGTVATYLAAIDESIDLAVIDCAISSFSLSIGAMQHCPCNYVPSMAKYFDMGEICQLIAPRKLAIISGEEDKLFPLEGAKKEMEKAMLAYEYYKKKDDLHFVTVNGGHGFYPYEVWGLLNSIYKI